jgi:hypothetical protein
MPAFLQHLEAFSVLFEETDSPKVIVPTGGNPLRLAQHINLLCVLIILQRVYIGCALFCKLTFIGSQW